LAYVRGCLDGDADYIASRLRTADRQEIAANSGLPPRDAIQRCTDASVILCTVVGCSGRPCAVFGVVPCGPITGCIWLLGTDELVSPPVRRQFIAEGRVWLDRLHDFRPLLFNFVDERNTLHIRWLKWVGCTFINRHPTYGHEARPFLEFVRVRQHV